MKADKEVTIIITAYNTEAVLKKAIDSVRKFHPYILLIIVDNSDKKNTCYSYANSLQDEFTQVFHMEKNFGHGKGLAFGVSKVKTPYFLTMDSDAEILESPIQAMLDMMEDATCVVGYIEKVDIGGHDYGARPQMMKYGWIKYVHPYFSLYQMKEYKKYTPFCHHGAPAINIMLDIYQGGLENVAIKEFAGLGHSGGQPINNAGNWKAEPRRYVKHDRDGTRISIESGWDKTIDPYGKKITCLTPTGDRLVALKLAKKWLASQTTQPDQWLVVDDGQIPIPLEEREGMEYVRREPRPGERHTLSLNIKAALPHITGDIILIIEDDDWYGPKYIETYVNYLKEHNLVGEGSARYYLLSPQKYYRLGNDQHASFCQTGLNRIFLPLLNRSCNNGRNTPYIDMELWLDSARDLGFLFFDQDDKLQIHCGMKGLPGRKGIGSGHEATSEYYQEDKKYEVLKRWIGIENVKIYESLVKGI